MAIFSTIACQVTLKDDPTSFVFVRAYVSVCVLMMMAIRERKRESNGKRIPNGSGAEKDMFTDKWVHKFMVHGCMLKLPGRSRWDHATKLPNGRMAKKNVQTKIN